MNRILANQPFFIHSRHDIHMPLHKDLSRTLFSVKIQSHHHAMKKWARRRQKFSRLAGKMLFRGLKIIRKVHDFNKNKKINQKNF